MGRPSSLPRQELEDNPRTSTARPSTASQERFKTALEASYGACTYLSSFVQQIPGSNNSATDSTEQLLGRMKTWSQSLHPSLRRLDSKTDDKQLLIGNTHHGCIHYFTVMLSTRPFLISHIAAQLQEVKPSTLRKARSPEEKEKITRLSNVCLDAATTIANLTRRVQIQDGLLGNMCLVKAFVFAAGLLIGFSLFASNSIDALSQTAYSNAQSVLQQLSFESPQAKHYHDILNDFADAIAAYHRQKLNKKQRATNQYLDHIFDLSPSMQLADVEADTTQQRYLSPVSGHYGNLDTGTSNAIWTEERIDFDDGVDFSATREMYDPGNLSLVWDDFGLT